MSPFSSTDEQSGYSSDKPHFIPLQSSQVCHIYRCTVIKGRVKCLIAQPACETFKMQTAKHRGAEKWNYNNIKLFDKPKQSFIHWEFSNITPNRVCSKCYSASWGLLFIAKRATAGWTWFIALWSRAVVKHWYMWVSWYCIVFSVRVLKNKNCTILRI